MCLIVDKLKTKELKNKKETKIGYKTLVLKEGNLYSCMYYHAWQVGVNKSRIREIPIVHTGFFARFLEYIESLLGSYVHYQAIEEGIHVYELKQDAKNLLYAPDEIRVVVPVYCKSEDLIAAGLHGDLVYTQIELKQEDYEKAFIKRKKKK